MDTANKKLNEKDIWLLLSQYYKSYHYTTRIIIEDFGLRLAKKNLIFWGDFLFIDINIEVVLKCFFFL